ncbi:MAG: tripartite tricarboxylate transporter TctB family protein [Pararhodobacter sp.]
MDRIRPESPLRDAPGAGPARANLTEVLAGLGVIALAIGFLWISRDYGFGSLRRMGAGFFPTVLGGAGVVLGAVICLRAVMVRDTGRTPRIRLRRLLFITAAFVTFGLAINPLGLPLSILLTSLVGSLADEETQLREAVLLAVFLALGIWGLFVGLLGLQLPVRPGFL